MMMMMMVLTRGETLVCGQECHDQPLHDLQSHCDVVLHRGLQSEVDFSAQRMLDAAGSLGSREEDYILLFTS